MSLIPFGGGAHQAEQETERYALHDNGRTARYCVIIVTKSAAATLVLLLLLTHLSRAGSEQARRPAGVPAASSSAGVTPTQAGTLSETAKAACRAVAPCPPRRHRSRKGGRRAWRHPS